MNGVRESGIPQEETLEVVTEDYKTVKVARHVVDNMKERIRKQMGLPEDWRSDEAKILYYRRQLALLEKADAAPRCEHIRADGTRCRGPRLRAGKKCYAHARMDEARPQRLRLPALEDANSVLLAVMEIQRALVDGLVSEKTAGLLLYSVQIGAWAAQQATFRETEPEEMIRRLPESPRLAKVPKVKGKDREPRRKKDSHAQNLFTAEDAKDAKANQDPEPQRTQSNTEGVPGRSPKSPALPKVLSPGMNGVSRMISGMKPGGGGPKDCQNCQDCQRLTIENRYRGDRHGRTRSERQDRRNPPIARDRRDRASSRRGQFESRI
jgi:hypothetical protein